jgi:hypothetical protein
MASTTTTPQPGEAGTKNFAGKSESRNSKSETTKNGKCEKKQSGRRRFKLFPRSDFYFVSKCLMSACYDGARVKREKACLFNLHGRGEGGGGFLS